MNQALLEWIGYTASLIVLVSLLMSSVKKLRWINLVGALIFGVYGFMIGSMPTGFMNLGIVIIDAYYLYRMYLSKEYLRVLPIEEDTEYLKYFLDFYKKDIDKYLDISNLDLSKATIKLYLLRNMNPAGIFVCDEYDNHSLEIVFDYVIPLFRDFKIGSFVFGKQKVYFLSKGYNRFVVFTDNRDHIRYLKKMGFIESKLNGKTGYTKPIE
ncbi:MAG: YgjV family protein [Candidatus Izimaplasma sp.]|nr:YgjV family protein [Candidatus Izimaplasma bacterium]